MNKPERNYSTIEREALAAVAAIKEFYPYLYGFPFTLITDHNPLTALKGLKDVGGRLARWMLFLQQFQFKIEYKPGKIHGDADALSRKPQGDGGVGGDAVDIGSGCGEGVGGDGDRGMETIGGHDAIGDGGVWSPQGESPPKGGVATLPTTFSGVACCGSCPRSLRDLRVGL